MTRVKICGITREEDLRAAVDAGADAVGFLVDVPVETPREILPERAAELAAQVSPFATSVLVTMPDSPERAVALAEIIGPDVLQIHGDIGMGDAAYLSSKTDAAVVKAVAAKDVADAHRYAEVADALLVDTDVAGGTGRTHDWSETRDLVAELDAPVILAGGLTPENVADAVAAVDPYGVDVASGVESNGGVKDHRAVANFVSRAKRQALEANEGSRGSKEGEESEEKEGAHEPRV